ncbi:MAG: hypothetical protein IJY47_07110 [Clostridia bacterium]|nr:hypothetical protein [Clostridia bacterium]
MKHETLVEGSVGTSRWELFAAANSGKGFYSYYPQVFERDEIDKRYLIKGGPGTGKSSFLREVAKRAEEKGAAVEYYRCSSDPDSLDGVILNRRIALLDATAPHAVEPSLPGTRDEIVNLGDFWDSRMLEERRNDISAYSALKGNCYRKAYRFLSAAMEVSEGNREMVEPYIRWEKMRRAVKRLMRSVPAGREFQVIPGLMDSLGMKGEVRLPTYEEQAETLYVLEDSFGIASAFLSMVIGEAENKKVSLRVSYQPLCPTLPNGVLLEESGIAFVLESADREPTGHVNMKRFLDQEGVRQIRGEYRRNLRLAEGLLQAATDSLADAGQYHFELEKIYVACMDFRAEQKFIRSFCQKLLEIL